MTIRRFVTRARRWRDFLGLALGVAALGCVTTGPSLDDEAELRKARSHHDLGAHYLSEGDVALAIRELRVAHELNPDDKWTHLHLALAYRLKAHPEDALHHLDRALEIDPEFQEARLTLSGFYSELGRYEEGEAMARNLLEDPTFPAPWRALTNLGWAQLQLDRPAEARRSLEMALEYNPSYWRAALNLGILMEREGKKLEALEFFERVLEAQTGPLARAQAEFRIAEIYIGLGKREDALEHLVAVTETRPNGQWGRRSKKYLKLLR